MAALIKRGSKWYIKFYDGSGKQRWVRGYTDKGATRDLAVKLENEAIAIRNGHVDPQVEQAKVERAKTAEQHIDAYERHLAAAGRSENHIRYTIADIRKCFEHAGVKHASQLTVAHVDAWVVSLASDAPRTINRRIGSVQAFLKHLQEHGAVGRYVLRRYAKRNVRGTEKRRSRALTAAEAAQLLKAAPEPRKTLYTVALRTGLRLNELRSLKAESFDMKHRTITVSAADAKNKERHQTIPLHDSLAPIIRKLIEDRGADRPLLDVPARADAAKLVRADCAAAKVPTTDITFHSLRHTFITRLAEAMIHPKILQTLARHSSIETTLGYYVHFRQDDERAAIAGLE